ncbi:MAG TPA: hypothetical protein VN461_22895 [Vicinamibacteria bacterium]|nr:hypothetical protein [Vicinamibacteria bacterium]
MRRPSSITWAVLGCATLVALLYVSPVLGDVARRGLDWPIWLNHPEGVSQITYGKWWVLPPHHYLSDGSSGEFPVYTYYLSDALINLIGEVGHWPAMTVQAVIYGPLLGFAFLLLNYYSIAAVVRDSRVAFWASLLISLGGNSFILDRPDPGSGFPLNFILHVPFHTISLGTAQSLGWVLFLPCLALTYLAYQHFSVPRAIASGALLALLFQTHTLTFVNAAFVQLVYLVLSNGLDRPRQPRFWIWLVALGLVAAAFGFLVATCPLLSIMSLIVLGTGALVATFAFDSKKPFYLWSYGTAGLVAAPYLLKLAQHARVLAAVQDAEVQRAAVGLAGLALFFTAYALAAALAYPRYRERPVLVWALAMLGATLFLAFNHLWHWNNHAYRFAIHLIFPLGILAALGLRHGPRPIAVALGAWLGAVCLLDVGTFAVGKRIWVSFRVGEPERAAFLRTVRETTASSPGSRILAPAEVDYPRGVTQAAMLMSYSRIQAFNPDYRRILWPERYHNRMGLFCFLFPGYPNFELQFNRRACEEDLDPDPRLLEIRDPRLKTAILPVYSIGLAGAPAKPFANSLKEASGRYGWPVVAETDSSALLRTVTPPLPGVARLLSADSSSGTLSIRVEVDVPGPHVAILGGRRLADRAPRVVLDGNALANGRRSANWAVFFSDLRPGPHRLELPARDSGPDPEADYLYFIGIVHEDWAPRYLVLGDVHASAGAGGVALPAP